MSTPIVRIKPKKERRIQGGHPWVYSNEIDGSVADLPPGGVVDVVSSHGGFIGRGYASPKGLIAVRLLTRNRTADLDAPGFYAARIREAMELRSAVWPERTAYRLIHGEADGIPGLVLDRYNDVVVAQISTLGIQLRADAIAQAVQDVLGPCAGVLRNDLPAREVEGLELGRSEWFGDVPDNVLIEVEGTKFRVAPMHGQRTGHYHDQSANRLFAASLCRGRTVLDVYANTGAWGLQALTHGAERAICVDKNQLSCEMMADNAELNGVSDRIDIVCDEGKRTLEALRDGGHRFGAIVLDPPPFARSRKAANSALRGYKDINTVALSLVSPGGFLFTNSCSYHVHEDKFLEVVLESAQAAGRRLKMIRRGEPGPDHPAHAAMPEARYLKSLAFQVLTEC